MLSRRLLRIKAIQSLYSHFKSGQNSLIKSEKEYVENIRKCYELYLLTMQIVVEVADMAENKIQLASTKLKPTAEDLNPNRRFVDNPVIALLRKSDQLQDALTRYRLSWRNSEQVIKEIYADMIEQPYYKRYMSAAECDFTKDRKVVLDFFKTHIEDNESVEEVLEEMSLFWIDDLEYALGFVIQTIGTISPKTEEVEILPMYKNDDDRDFAQELYRKALVNCNQYYATIESLAENWDFERIAFMDKIILLAAICELEQFSSIPVKVTMDEYIEISKYYSTPQSSLFINGILDKAIEKLTAEGKIVKQGRGLLDQ